MSYIKTNWVNNTTPISSTNMNKIEQGIYDNSVNVDIINSTLNPSGETYKLQTVTEGQITEVLGISNIKLKGNTVQDGTPTPSAPVDINVVSGDNVIEIKSKNLININTLSNGYILGTGDISTQSTNEEMYSEFIKVKPNTAYTFKIFETTWSGFNSSNWIGIGEYSSIQNPIRNGFIQRDIMGIGTQNYYTITTTANTNYIIVSARGLVSATKIQLEQNSTATSYINYHSGKEFSLNLGSIELCEQDYFYKFENDWYLHKEINKINSYNGETITTSYISTTGELSTGAKVYYVVNSTNTKITDTTLISQLEAIYNAPLYEETKITQTNNDLPFILDITAFKDNINGIKAWIRK